MTNPIKNIITAALAPAAILIFTAVSPVYGALEQGNDLSFKLTLGVSRTDNRDTVPNGGYVRGNRRVDKVSDTTFRISPAVQYEKQFPGGYDFRLYYKPSYIWHTNPREGGIESELTHSIDALLGFQITPSTRFVITDNLWWSGDKTWNYGENYVYSPDERAARDDTHYMNKLSAMLSLELTVHLKATIDGSYHIKRYDDNHLAFLYDEDIYKLGGSLTQVYNRHFSFGVFTEYTSFDRSTHGKITDRPAIIDMGVQYLKSGFQASFDLFGDKRFVFNGDTGYNHLWHEADNIPDDSMWGDTTIKLNIYQQERTGGSLGVRFGKQYSDIFPYSSQGDNSFYGSIFTTIGRPNMRNVKVGVDGEWRRREYKAYNMDDDVGADRWYSWLGANGYAEKGTHNNYWLRVWAKYRITQNIDTSVFYSYEEVVSDVNNDYSAQIFGGSVTFTWDTMRSIF